MTRLLEIPPPRRLLIIKPSSLGDVVSAMPVLRALRRAYPESHIAWLVSRACAAVIQHDSDLNEAVLFDRKRLGAFWRSPSAAGELLRFRRQLRRGGYDCVLDLQGLLRSALFARMTRAAVRVGFADPREGAAAMFYTHRVQARSLHTVERNMELVAALGVQVSADDFTLQVTQAARAYADSLAAAGLARGGFVACVPPTRWATKMLPVRHWRSVIAQLVHHVPVAILGTPADEKLCAAVAEGFAPDRVVNLAGKTDLPQMVGVLAAARLVICSDSAAQFIAPAVGVDVITIVGPTRVDRTGPYVRGRAVVARVACQGCLKRYCSHTVCMETIDPGEIVSAAMEIVGSSHE